MIREENDGLGVIPEELNHLGRAFGRQQFSKDKIQGRYRGESTIKEENLWKKAVIITLNGLHQMN